MGYDTQISACQKIPYFSSLELPNEPPVKTVLKMDMEILDVLKVSVI
jgi:hypothetical protein